MLVTSAYKVIRPQEAVPVGVSVTITGQRLVRDKVSFRSHAELCSVLYSVFWPAATALTRVNILRFKKKKKKKRRHSTKQTKNWVCFSPHMSRQVSVVRRLFGQEVPKKYFRVKRIQHWSKTQTSQLLPGQSQDCFSTQYRSLLVKTVWAQQIKYHH